MFYPEVSSDARNEWPRCTKAPAGALKAMKAAYAAKDMQDWARQAGLKIKMPPSVFPVNSVKVMRGCIVLEPPFANYAAPAQEIARRTLSRTKSL